MSSSDDRALAPPSSKVLRFAVRPDGVAVITCDVEGATVNTISPSFIEDLDRAIGWMSASSAIKAALLVSGKPDGFIAGADLAMIEAVGTASQAEAMCLAGHAAVAKLGASPKPIVAAVHGAALGGGFEVALACHARVLSDDERTVLALPEVQLGLLPGMHGLQRLAAIAGLRVAMEYGLTGKNMRPAVARSLGIAAEVVSASSLHDVAAELALALAAGGAPFRYRAKAKLRTPLETLAAAALEKNPIGRAILFRKARARARRKTGGHYPAPARILDVLEVYASRGFDASAAVEAKSFGELAVSHVARRLIEIFFATASLKKEGGTGDADVRPREVATLGVIGAGLMGAGIAGLSVASGLRVRMKDRDEAALGRGRRYVADIVGERAKKKRMTRLAEDALLARFTTGMDDSAMREADLVIEAVFEDLAVKQEVLRAFEAVAKESAIFASSTSSIPIASIAALSKRPENVIGMHYMSPVHRMPLLEVVKTARTAPEVVATGVALGKKQGKTVIVVSDGAGFYTTRILGPYLNEAAHLLVEGASVEQIDGALTAWGWPVGPLALLDEVGVDIAARVGPILREAFGDRLAPPPLIAELSARDRLGRKNGRGFYVYAAEPKGRGKEVDPTVYDDLRLSRPPLGAKNGPVPREEIQMRGSLQFVNEAFFALGEGILGSPRDGDIGAIFGLGFPAFRGGPFRYVDAIGAVEILKRIEGYRLRFGARWTPAPALVALAKSGKKLYT